MMRETFLVKLAEKAPVLFWGQGVYLAAQSALNEYVQFRNSGVKLGLTPAGSLNDLIEFNRTSNRKEIYLLKKSFIDQGLKLDFISDDERKKEIDNRKLFVFIINELMPFLSGHKEKTLELLEEQAEEQKEEKGDDKNAPEAELYSSIEKIKQGFYIEQQAYCGLKFNGNKDEFSFFQFLIKGKNILTLGEKIYSLEGGEENSELVLNLNNSQKNLNLSPLSDIKAVDEAYSDFLKWKIKSEAIEEFSGYIKEKQATKLAALRDIEGIMQLREFSDGDIGFLQKDGEVYVYQKIPPFCMLDPRPSKKKDGPEEEGYQFPEELRVGMHIQYLDERIYLKPPVLFESVWHPFVRSKNQQFQELCGGRVVSRDNYSEVEWVAKCLDDAKNIVMHGLSPESIKRHGGGETEGGNYFGTPLDEKLEPRKIKVSEAKAKGLAITNKWDWKKNG